MPKILKIRTQAFCLEPVVLNCYAITYGVSCRGAKNAPWDVEFVGPENGLREMLKEHWCMDQTAIDEVIQAGEQL